MIYLVLLTAIFCAVYLSLLFVLPAFFKSGAPRLSTQSLLPLLWIIDLSLFAYYLSFAIPNEELSNRILHAFGGGFLAFLTCFFAVKHSAVQLTKFQFFFVSALIVTALGVGNELLEFLFQSTTGVIFAPTISDTWLDLTSNTVGLLLAAAVFVPFIENNKSKK